MNLRFINITEKAGENETMSRKDNLRHRTLETHSYNGAHDKSHDHDDDDDDDDDDDNDTGPWSEGAGGNGNSDGNKHCCDSLAMGCVIQDNDPRVHYEDPSDWVLNVTHFSTIHYAVEDGSTVSLIFNGKFYQCPLRDPDTQLTLQVALSLSLAQSPLVIIPNSRQLHTSLIHCLPLSRHYPKQPLIFLTSRFILLLICHRTKNIDSLSTSLKPSLRHRIL